VKSLHFLNCGNQKLAAHRFGEMIVEIQHNAAREVLNFDQLVLRGWGGTFGAKFCRTQQPRNSGVEQT